MFLTRFQDAARNDHGSCMLAEDIVSWDPAGVTLWDAGLDQLSTDKIRLLGTITAARVSSVYPSGALKQLVLQLGVPAGGNITSPGTPTYTACPPSAFVINGTRTFGTGATCFTDSKQLGLLFVNLGSNHNIVPGRCMWYLFTAHGMTCCACAIHMLA